MIKKFFAVIVSILVLFSVTLPVTAAGTVYADSTTGITFTVPDDWHETALSEQREIIKVKYMHKADGGSTIMFGYGDMWGEIPASDKVGYSRADIDHDMFKQMLSDENLTVEDYVKSIGVDVSNSTVDTAHYNGYEYFKITLVNQITVLNVTADITLVYLIHIDNGYIFTFWYGYMDENIHKQDFDFMMNSVTYPLVKSDSINSDNSVTSSVYVPSYDYDTDTLKDTNKGSGVVYFEGGEMKFNFPLFIISLIVTIIIYSLPIIIYRYAIKKQPLPEKKAKKITIIYGIVAFIVMAVVSGAAPGSAIILWSTINYKMLTKPSKRDIYVDTVTYNSSCMVPVTPQSDESIVTKEPEIIESTESTPEPLTEEIDEPKQVVTETIHAVSITKVNDALKIPVVEEYETNENITQTDQTNSVVFCRKCGTRLSADSEFCHKCGTRIIK